MTEYTKTDEAIATLRGNVQAMQEAHRALAAKVDKTPAIPGNSAILESYNRVAPAVRKHPEARHRKG